MKKGFLLIILISAAVVVFYGARYVKSPVSTEVAYITKCEESIEGEAFIVKNETVNTALGGGMLYTYATDGERVGKNRKIASIYNSSVNTDLLKELNNIDKKIQSIKTNSSKSTQNSDTSDESLVLTYTNDIFDAVYDGNISEIYNIKSDIKAVREGGGEQTTESDDLESLESKRETIESKIGNMKNDVYSQTAGVFVSGTDGFEDILTEQTMLNMTVSDFDALSRDIEYTQPSSVSKGDKICKIVDNNKWYIVLKTESEKLENSKVGDSVTLKFDAVPGTEVSANIYSISAEENGEVLLFIECEKYIDGIFSIRYSDVEVVLRQYTGYRIPIYAIRVQDNQTGVMVSKNLNEVFKPCEIVYTDEEEGFVVIRSLDGTSDEIEQNDTIIIGEK
jgi:putative membrane fusion protein